MQGYKNVRLSFGLRCSPTILMIGLYQILMLNTLNDVARLRDLKRLIYGLIYMDNGAVTMDSSENLRWAYNELSSIFNPYQFELQQFYTNDRALQSEVSLEDNSVVGLFGLNWDTTRDTLFANKHNLNVSANTKRKILKTVAERFDPCNFDGPVFNRARLFLHSLQVQTDVGWDQGLLPDKAHEWLNICKQVNTSPPMSVPRFVGSRKDSYRLIAFTDSSKVIYGTVIFIQSLTSNDVSFLLAKNKIVGRQLQFKSIPTLESMGIFLGTETLLDLRRDLARPQSVS